MKISSPSRLARFVGVRTPLTAVGLTVAALVIGTAVPAAAGVKPVGAAKALNAVHPIATKTYVSPVAGTTNTSSFDGPWAVFRRNNVVGRTVDPTGDLLAVTGDGSSVKFGVVTPDMRTFSLSSYTLTAVSSANPSHVYWWQPPYGGPNNTYETGTLGSGDRYLASAPDGWVEIAADGTLYDVPAAAGESSARSLGNPFGTALNVEGISGPTGVVVWNDSQIKFVPFGAGPITSLDMSRLTHLAGGTNTPVCWSASASAVACGSDYFTGEDNSGLRNLFIDPLNGAPALAVTTDFPQPATMLGSHAAWLTETGKLRVLGHGTLVTATSKVGAWPVAGLGGFLTTDSKRDTGIKVGGGGKQTKTVLPSALAVEEATQFALTNGTVIWLQNRTGGAAVHRRAVARNAFETGLRTGPAHQLAKSKALRGQLAAAGDTVAYPTDLNNTAVGENGGQTLHVVTPTRSATIHGVDRYLPVTLGDHRVAYYTDSRSARLYNLKTRKTTKFAGMGIALSGHSLAYADAAGTVRLKNLDSGTVRTVATGVQIVEDQLFVHGQIVAWNAYPPGFGGHIGYVRNMAVSDGVIQLPAAVNVWQLSDAGLVLEHTPAGPGASSPSFPGDRGLRFHPAMTFLLQPYDGSSASTLLVADYPISGPQVAGNVVAWIDQHGRVRARALD